MGKFDWRHKKSESRSRVIALKGVAGMRKLYLFIRIITIRNWPTIFNIANDAVRHQVSGREEDGTIKLN